MKIVSRIKRCNGHRVVLDGTAYEFTPPDYVAEVANQAHAERFLSIPEGYGLADASAPAAQPKKVEPVAVSEDYLGSEVHPAEFEIGGKTYEQTEIVKMAAAGRSAAEWNALSEGERADLIDDQLDKLADTMDGKDDDDATDGDKDDTLEGDLNGDGDLDREELAKLYEAKFGKRPHGKWNADKIREALGDA